MSALLSCDERGEYSFFVDAETASNCAFPERAKVVSVATSVPPTRAASASGHRSVRDLWAMSREVMKHDLDVFFFPAIYSYFPIVNRTKVIVTIHDAIVDNHPDAVFPNRKSRAFWAMKQFFAMRQADLILTVSDYSKAQIKNRFNLPEHRIRAISEGAGDVFRLLQRDDKMVQTLRKYGIGGDDRFLLYVGGISPHKNLDTLIDAYHQLIADPRFSDLRLVLVGDYKNDSFYSSYPALRAQIGRLALVDRVILTGFVTDEDLAYIYNAAAILVLPSFDEGFGLPVVEAMACGTPVICSRRGALPEVLGSAGRFFDPSDPAALLRAAKDVLTSAALRGQLIREGLTRAKNFTWHEAANRLLSVFADLIEDRTRINPTHRLLHYHRG